MKEFVLPATPATVIATDAGYILSVADGVELLPFVLDRWLAARADKLPRRFSWHIPGPWYGHHLILTVEHHRKKFISAITIQSYSIIRSADSYVIDISLSSADKLRTGDVVAVIGK